MWPFTAAQASRETIESKRAHRADALSLAPVFSENEHQKYLDSTGEWSFGAYRLVCADSLSFSAAKQIVENIQAGAWTAAAVLEAFIARAGQAQEATNCLTEGARLNQIVFIFELTFPFCSVLFEEAREEARKLDAEFAETGKLKGLLHGVPITLKDMSVFPLPLFVRGSPGN